MIQRITDLSTHALILVFTAAHALVAGGLLAFGLRAGGYPLNRWAVYEYGVVAAVALLWSAVATLRSARQSDGERSGWAIAIPPLLAVWVVGMYATTEVLHAEFAPYLDDQLEIFAGLNVLFALGGCTLALLYRWPRLLLAWAGGQGALLLTNPGLNVTLFRWGAPGLVGWVTLGIPLAYASTALALGWRPTRRPFLLSLAGTAAVGLALAMPPTLRLVGEGVRDLGTGPGLWALALVSSLGTAAYWALVAALPLYAGIAWRTWPTAEREEGSRRWTWVAVTVVLWISTALASFAQVAPDGRLPAAGAVQGWRASEQVVPAAWSPTITWAGWLFTVVRWLLVPYVLLGLVGAARRWRPRLALPSVPASLVWAGLGWLAAFAWDLSPVGFPLHVAGESYSMVSAFFLPLVGGMLLVVAGRAAERRWGPWGRRFWRLVTLGGCLALLTWIGQAAWAYGRVLFAPLPAWTERWGYAPLPRVLLTSLGLTIHLFALGLGAWALVRTLGDWAGPGPMVDRRRLRSLVQSIALPLLVLAILAGFGWWATAPPVVRTVPANGATDVPRDTAVRIEMAPEKGWLGFLLGGSGQGVRTRYADTGDYIPGGGGGTGHSFTFDPEGLLRPNAPVAITVYRTGERPYTLRFTTAGVGGPTATPMPDFPGPHGPIPTPAREPPSTPAGEDEAIGYLRPAPPGADHAFTLETAGGTVRVAMAEGARRDNLEWLMEHGHLTLVRGRWLSQDPPVLEAVRGQGAARPFNRSTPMAQLYTDPLHGYAIEYPAGWIVERDGEVVSIQNYHSAEVPEGYNPLEDPSLYRVRIILEGKSLDQLREAYLEAEQERSGQINGREAMWLTVVPPSPEGRPLRRVLVDWDGRALSLSTYQDPALLERMAETLRAAEGEPY